MSISQGLPASRRNSIDNTQNRRIRVGFSRQNMMLGYTKQDVETILNRVWAQFGSPSAISYHPGGGYCFLTFGSHQEANEAMNRLKDQVNFVATAEAQLLNASGELEQSQQTQRSTKSQKSRAVSQLVHLLGINPAPR
jgi:hypothetical protein